MGKRIVIALGGNALGSTPYEQLALVTETAKPIVDLIEQGNEVVIAHGNGPQVGMINLGMATAAEAGAIKSDMPFPECGAMSQATSAITCRTPSATSLPRAACRRTSPPSSRRCWWTRTIPPSRSPRSLSAHSMTRHGRAHRRREGYTMVEDAGRGYRQVVPSPKPMDIIEKDAVNALFQAGCIVIAAGGGGIPVVRREGKLVAYPRD